MEASRQFADHIGGSGLCGQVALQKPLDLATVIAVRSGKIGKHQTLSPSQGNLRIEVSLARSAIVDRINVPWHPFVREHRVLAS
jgi:hypothetical protein